MLSGCRGGSTIGTKRTILVDILGLPFAVRADPAKPHAVLVGREFLAEHLDELPRLTAVVRDRGFGAWRPSPPHADHARHEGAAKGLSKFMPLALLYRVEHDHSRLGHRRRLSRCDEGTEASACAWLEVASVAYLFARLRVEPP